jgi:hypothetical protein
MCKRRTDYCQAQEAHWQINDMASKAFSPSVVRSEPKISLWCTTKHGSIKPAVGTEDRGDILTRSLWEKVTDCILHVIFMDTGAKSYGNKGPQKVLR